MSKTRLWKIAVIALCIVVLLALGTTLLLSTLAKNATADETLVLEGNTAKYNFVNDTSNTDGYDTLWTYSRSANEWKSAGDTASEKIETTLTLNITGEGNLVFQWRVAEYKSTSAGTEASFKVIVVSGGQEETKFQRSADTTPMTDEVKQYGDAVTIEGLKQDDTVKLVFKSGFGNANSGYIRIKGLIVPTEKFDVTAQVDAESVGHGTINTEKEDESFAENKIVASRGYDESVTFTAVPQEGYVAYWTRSGRTIKSGNEYKVSSVSEKSEGDPFVVHFIEKNSEKITINFDKADDGKMGWEKTEKGYELKQIPTDADLLEEVFITFEFVGERYVSFDYDFMNNDFFGAVSSAIYIDGEYSWDYSISTTGEIGGESKTDKITLKITGEGYHFISVSARPSGAGGINPTGTETFRVENVQITKQAPRTQIKVKYDPRTADLYLDSELHSEEGSGIKEAVLDVPSGEQFTLKLQPKEQVTSTLDPQQMATVKYVDGTANAQFYNQDKSGYVYPSFALKQGYVELKITQTTRFLYTIDAEVGYGGSSHDYTLDSDADTLELSFAFKEVALAPTVTATKTIDGDEERIEEPIQDGQAIEFPFNHTNALTLYISTFEGFNTSDIGIKVDGEDRSSTLQDMGNNGFMFGYQLKYGATITIYYAKEDDDNIVYSDYSITFELKESVEGDISNIDHTADDTTGSLAIANDEQNEWKFDPSLSAENNYVYGLSVDKPFRNGAYYLADTFSNLSFTMTGATSGSLTLEFMVKGYYQGGTIASKPSKVGQLWYANKSFTQSDNKNVASDQTIDGATWLGRPTESGDMEYNSMVLAVGDGWYKVSIPISEGVPVYLGFLVCGKIGAGDVGVQDNSTASAAIRNVCLVTGNKNVTVKLGNDASDGASASAVVNDNTHNATKQGVPFNVDAGAMVKLSAKLDPNEVFYGWTVGDMLVSTELETSVFINEDCDIVAWIAPQDAYSARVRGLFFEKIKDAVEVARFGDTVFVIKDGVTISESFTIESGVTLLLPYSSENKFTATGNKNRISWIADEATYRYLTVNVATDVIITVKGTLRIGGVVNCEGQGYQGHTSGAYAEMILAKGSKIQVADGGVMDVYGRVWGGKDKTDAEMGVIDVASGGKLYEPFLILDYSGGTNAAGLFLSDNPVTPFKRYAMINIECPITINYGGQMIGHASLFALSQFFSLDQVFIGDDSALSDKTQYETFVMLSKGSKVTLTYDSTKVVDGTNYNNCTEGIGKITMVFEGGATFSYMIFSAMGISVPTNPVYFSIPYNYEVELNGEGANYETKTDFMIMPGAKVTLGEGANLTLNANAWVFDGFEQPALSGKSYPTATKLKEAGYSQNGNFIVNGTLTIGKKTPVKGMSMSDIMGGGGSEEFDDTPIPATFLGVVQTTGTTGKIVIPAGTVLQGTVYDGTSNTNNYFAYTTKARVWDSVNSCFGNLEAGHTYLAKGDGEFTLDKINYTKTKGGEENLQLQIDETLHGNWMIEHEDHVFDWSYDAEKDTLPDGSTKHTQITRYCTEMGCDGHETRELVFTPESWGNITFTGKVLTDDDLKPIINKLFGDSYDLFEKAGGSLSYGTIKDVNNAGYDVKVTLSKGFFVSEQNYNGELTLKITVVKATLQDGDVQVDTGDETYTGEAITKQVVVTYNGVTLAEHTDYLVDWGDDNTNVGEVTITVTGTGTNFAGTVTKTFRIVPRSVSDASVVWDEGDKKYTGDQIQPSVRSVTVNGKPLTAQDYTVEYGANLVKGKGTVTIKGNGNYNGEKQLEFNILAKNMSGAKVTIDGEYTFDGQKQEPKVTVSLDGFDKQLNKDTDYDLSFGESDLIKAGQVTVTATFKGNYEGSAQGTFEIKQKDIANLTFGGVNESYTYTGKAIQPTVTVKFDQVDLTKDDFDVVYGTNTAVADQGTVTVNGKGNYTGSKQFTFTITPADASQAQVEVNGSYTYNAQAQSVQVTVTLANFTVTSSDYTIEYGNSDRTNAGTVKFTVQFKGNFSGSVEQSFEIGKAQVKVTPNNAESPQGEAQVQLSYRIDGTMYGDDLNTLKSVLTVKLANDENVSEAEADKSFDIVVTLGETELTKNYNIDVSAKGTYTITEAVFKDVTVADVTVDYDGKTHPVSAQNLPDGAKATYVYKQGDSAIEGEPKDAGNYNVTITVTMGSYKSLVLNRTVTITAKKLTVTLQKQSVVFNTKEQHASSDKQYWSVEGVVDGESVTLTIAGTLTNVGSANLVATPVPGEGTKLTNYSVDSAQLTLKDGFTVEQKDIAELTFGGVNGSYTYTGKAIQPTVTVKFDQVDLTKDDFDVVYGTNTAVAEQGTVTVNGKGNYTGSKQFTFTITPADASQAQVKVNGSYTYNAQAQSVQVTVTLANFAVTSSDYTIEYGNSDRTNAGTVKFTVQFKGNFSGSVSSQFEIGKATVTEITVNEGTSFTYDGEEQQITFVVKAGSLTLSAGDYDLSNDREDDLTNAGAVNFTAKGKGNFQGEKSVTVTIARAQLTQVTVQNKDSHVYNGKQQQVELEVKAGDLTANVGDYSVNYQGNLTNAGTVTVTVTGTGNFQGEVSDEFVIAKAEIGISVEDKNSVYGYDTVALTYVATGIAEEDKTSVLMDAYVTLSCSASAQSDADEYDITATVSDSVSELANYTVRVTRQGTYTINARPLTVTIRDQQSVYGYNKTYDFDLTAWDITSGELVEGDELHFTLVQPQFDGAGDYDITVTESDLDGNYALTFEGSNGTAGKYSISKLDVSDSAVFYVTSGDMQVDDNGVVKLDGDAVEFTGGATVMEDKLKELKVSIDPQSIDSTGEHTLTLTIEDKNYSGSKSYSITVIDGDMSAELYKALRDLEALTGDMQPNELETKQEHYELVKGVRGILDGLSDEVWDEGEEELSFYQEFVDVWDNSADVDDNIVQTAKAIADAPIKGLFVVATLNALLAVAYAVAKGGIL